MAKILVVDDSALMRRLVRRMLEPRGHEIVEAGDDAQARCAFVAERPDVVLLDLNLGAISGLEVMAQLLGCDDNARVVMVTADTEAATRTTVLAAGARGFLVKPFDPGVVAATVDQILA
jgi:two-component system chemotaxis response regulator CheY